MFYVHRLVGVSFLDNPNGLPTINHKDENKANNCVSNLEWCSYSYNNNYGTCRERGSKSRFENGNTRQIDVYDLRGNLIKQYDCSYKMEADGLSRRAVYNVCKGRNRSYKGCVFRFANEPFSYKLINGKGRSSRRQIVKMNENGDVICTYPTIKSAEKANGLSRNCLYNETYAWTQTAFINGYYYKSATKELR